MILCSSLRLITRVFHPTVCSFFFALTWVELFYSIDETAHPSVYHIVSVYLSQLDNDNMKIAIHFESKVAKPILKHCETERKHTNKFKKTAAN